MTGAMVTLATGEAVSIYSDEWRNECFKRWQSVVDMRSMSIHARRAALDEVEQQEGALARSRLEEAFRKDWNDRKGAAA